jgi:hypothetical protein
VTAAKTKAHRFNHQRGWSYRPLAEHSNAKAWTIYLDGQEFARVERRADLPRALGLEGPPRSRGFRSRLRALRVAVVLARAAGRALILLLMKEEQLRAVGILALWPTGGTIWRRCHGCVHAEAWESMTFSRFIFGRQSPMDT